MKRRGVCYDVGRVMWGQNWRPEFSSAESHRELQIIRDDLHCNSGAPPPDFRDLHPPRRAPIVSRLRRAQTEGTLPASLDPEVVLEAVMGALFHRLLLGGLLDPAYAPASVHVRQPPS